MYGVYVIKTHLLFLKYVNINCFAVNIIHIFDASYTNALIDIEKLS